MTAVSPSSSPTTAMMKSDSAAGIRAGSPSPKPRPIRPPHAMPNMPSTICPLPGLWS